jgi:hypothetical protein
VKEPGDGETASLTAHSQVQGKQGSSMPTVLLQEEKQELGSHEDAIGAQIVQGLLAFDFCWKNENLC